jgi:hypothetical protein
MPIHLITLPWLRTKLSVFLLFRSLTEKTDILILIKITMPLWRFITTAGGLVLYSLYCPFLIYGFWLLFWQFSRIVLACSNAHAVFSNYLAGIFLRMFVMYTYFSLCLVFYSNLNKVVTGRSSTFYI